MRKFITLTLAVCMLLALATACQSNDSPADPSSNQNPEQGSLAQGEDVSTGGIQELICSDAEWEGSCVYLMSTAPVTHGLVEESIFIREPDGSYTPNVAESYEISDDGKTLTIVLPDDLQFYDGTYVTAYDLKRSIEWGHEVSSNGPDWDAITSIDADGQVLTIHMDDGFSSNVPFYLASMFMPIVSGEDIDTMTEEELLWGARIFGPYYVSDYVSGDHVTLKVNPYYKTRNTHVSNKEAPYVPTITVRFMTEQFPIVQAFLGNEMDISSQCVQDSFTELAGADVNIVSLPSDGVVSLVLNNDCELFQDERVRLAIAYAIDRDQIVEYSEETINAAYSILAKTCTGYDAAVDEWFKENFTVENGQEKALELLAEAGWTDSNGDGWLDKDGKTLEFTAIDYRDNSTIQNILQIQMQDIGINMHIEVIENAQWTEEVKTNDTYEACLSSYYWGDGPSTLRGCIRDMNILSTYTEYYDLCVKAGMTVDEDEAKSYLSEAQRMMLGEGYVIPVANPDRIMVFSNRCADNIYYNEAMWRAWVNDVQ